MKRNNNRKNQQAYLDSHKMGQACLETELGCLQTMEPQTLADYFHQIIYLERKNKLQRKVVKLSLQQAYLELLKAFLTFLPMEYLLLKNRLTNLKPQSQLEAMTTKETAHNCRKTKTKQLTPQKVQEIISTIRTAQYSSKLRH